MFNPPIQTLDKQTATQLFKLAQKYAPEGKAEKKARLVHILTTDVIVPSDVAEWMVKTE